MFLSLTLVANAFKGIQVCVIYLILSAGTKMLKGIKKTAFNITILSLVVLCMIITSVIAVNFSTIYYILISGFAGVIAYSISAFNRNKEASR